jgi:transposase
MVLLAAEGMASRAIGRKVGCTTGTASKWRVRYARDRLARLDETGNRGAEPKYTAENARYVTRMTIILGAIYAAVKGNALIRQPRSI